MGQQNAAATDAYAHPLAARTPVHEDGGRDHDAPLVHFVHCDRGFNSSWSWRTRRCEVIRIGDREDAGQIASSMPKRTPVSGDWAFGYIVNSPGPMGSVRVKLTTGLRYLSMIKRRYRSLRTSCCSSTHFLGHCVDPSTETGTLWPTQCVICTRGNNNLAHRISTSCGPLLFMIFNTSMGKGCNGAVPQ